RPRRSGHGSPRELHALRARRALAARRARAPPEEDLAPLRDRARSRRARPRALTVLVPRAQPPPPRVAAGAREALRVPLLSRRGRRLEVGVARRRALRARSRGPRGQ